MSKPLIQGVKTRSMAKKPSLNGRTTSSAPMTTDVVYQAPSCTRSLPGRVTRSGVNKNEEKSSREAALLLKLPTQPASPCVDTLSSAPYYRGCSFSVPAGVQSFVFSATKLTFTPLSPNSADKFFATRSSVRAPRGGNENVESSEKGGCGLTAEDTSTVQMKVDGANEVITDVLDAKYFRNIANKEVDRLKSLCVQWKDESERDERIPEEGEYDIGTQLKIFFSNTLHFTSLLLYSNFEGPTVGGGLWKNCSRN